MSLVLLLAAMCVAEISAATLEECVTQWGINAKHADRREIPLEQQVREYNTVYRVDRRGRWLVESPRLTWIRELDAAGAMPPSWPSHKMRWENWRPRWLRTLEAAQAYLDDPPPFPRADHYGGDCQDPRHACDKVPKHWTRVFYDRRGRLTTQERSDTAQAYWVIRTTKGIRLNRVMIVAAAD